jgi:hypothetical protein
MSNPNMERPFHSWLGRPTKGISAGILVQFGAANEHDTKSHATMLHEPSPVSRGGIERVL